MKLMDTTMLYGKLIIERISDREILNVTLSIVFILSRNVETLSSINITRQLTRNIKINISNNLFTKHVLLDICFLQ